jgi:hypothetical protein
MRLSPLFSFIIGLVMMERKGVAQFSIVVSRLVDFGKERIHRIRA